MLRIEKSMDVFETTLPSIKDVNQSMTISRILRQQFTTFRNDQGK